MTGRERQRAAAAATKLAIAEAAAHEFVTHGYAGASQSRIAERLGLTKGALVYHFRAKADFASHFVGVLREATAQADAFARAEYPDSAPRQLLLYFMLTENWQLNEPQVAAGMALFTDNAAPAFDVDDVIQDWLKLSIDAFEACRIQGALKGEHDSRDAAEMFLVTNLGMTIFGRHVCLNEPGTKPLRFVRLTLAAVGIPDVEKYADEVVDTYTDRLPELRITRNA